MPNRPGSDFETLLDSGEPLLGPLIRGAFRWYQDAVQERLALRGEEPLSLTQFELFARIDRDGTTIAELARRMGITRQSAHQAVRELARTGLVRVEPDPSSARSRLARPTARAAERIRVVREVLREIEDQLAARLGTRTVAQLRQILDADWGTPTTGTG